MIYYLFINDKIEKNKNIKLEIKNPIIYSLIESWNMKNIRISIIKNINRLYGFFNFFVESLYKITKFVKDSRLNPIAE